MDLELACWEHRVVVLSLREGTALVRHAVRRQAGRQGFRACTAAARKRRMASWTAWSRPLTSAPTRQLRRRTKPGAARWWCLPRVPPGSARPGSRQAGRGAAATGAVYPALLEGPLVRRPQRAAGDSLFRVHGPGRHHRPGTVAQLCGHAGRVAAAGRVLAGRPAAWRGQSRAGGPAARAAGRVAAAVASAARCRGLDPGRPDRSGRLACVCLPGAQAAGRGARRLHRGLLVGVRAAVPDLPGLVGDLASGRRPWCGDPDTFVAFLVDARPGAGGPEGADPAGRPGPGPGGGGGDTRGPVADQGGQWLGRGADRPAAGPGVVAAAGA